MSRHPRPESPAPTDLPLARPWPTTATGRPRLVALATMWLVLALLNALPASATGGAAGGAPASEPVKVDGITFGGWSDFVTSEYFQAAGLRCGTLDHQERGLIYGVELGDPSDCSANSTNPTAEYDPDTLYEIQVVVHILMDSSCNQGAISNALVDSQIDILNEDLLALMGTNGGNGTDGQIRFVLASVDPDGNATTGITRTCNTSWFNDSGSYWNSLAWDPNRYLNIYTNQASGALGYVPFLPADSGGSLVGTAQDRVVVLWSSFGRNAPIGPPYNQGRTTTHEVGHYLGLEHTFHPEGSCGSGPAPGCYSDGDLVCDTNVERDPGSSPCQVGASSSCGSVDPTDNYMDYSDDLCMERFTVEQIRRVRCTLQSYRPDLYQVVGGGSPPVVTITAPANGSSFPSGTSISFSGTATDAEDGNLTGSLSWSSSLDGALGTGGSFQAVLSVGTHTVTASVTDSDGQSGSSQITVTVTGGGNTPPSVTITTPSNGASFPDGTSIAFSGTATDAEDGNLTGSLSWSSNLDGALGTGGSFQATLSAGTHTVTASVTDSGGLAGSDQITVTVTASCSGGGGLAETFEGGAGGWTTGGLWHLVESSGCASPGYSSPIRAMYYGQNSSCDYDTGGTTAGNLISPEIGGITADSTLTFDYFREVEGVTQDAYDRTIVSVREVGGSWTTVWSKDSRDASENAWTSSGALSLAAFAGQSIQVRFRFDSVDEIANDFTGWMIDDVVVTGDCGGNAIDRIGAYRPSSRLFLMDVDGSGTWTPATDQAAQFGVSDDLPLIGDWNGDGDDDVGVYRPSDRLFLLDLDESGTWTPASDLLYQMGAAGDQPIIGDWNGDGDDDVGVYRPSTRQFLLDLDESGTFSAASDLLYQMGVTGDLPLIGDWNGDGDDDVGIYRPSNRVFLLDWNENGAWNPGVDLGYLMGVIGDLPLAGDWNGDGDDEIGVYRPSNRVFLLDADEGGTWSPATDLGYSFGVSGDTPITGKW